MGIIHTVLPFKDGGLRGIQACQRDWSNYLVHFTCAAAMHTLKKFPCKIKFSPKTLAQKIEAADKESFKVVKKIHSSMSLRPATPSEKDGIDKCVCFSECNLPGLINHCERYGRFGFVFRKNAIFALGGRPTIYVDNDMYAKIAAQYREAATLEERRLFSLANLYSPPGEGVVQDFTHEREWRLFSELSLASSPPEAILCPRRYYNEIFELFKITVIPIDLLDEWGL